MSDTNSHNITDQELDILEQQVEALINSCSHLRQENRILRGRNETQQQERAELLKKNNAARTRVDAMITRLKSLEANT
jgi:cell division protein ZapB